MSKTCKIENNSILNLKRKLKTENKKTEKEKSGEKLT
jgi:hypothetical protein